MIKQTSDEFPGLASIMRCEERRGFDATIQSVGLAIAAKTYLPDIFQGSAAILRKFYVGLKWIGPGLAEVIAAA
jgi:hypothetical protein